jgi:hypothetical protein
MAKKKTEILLDAKFTHLPFFYNMTRIALLFCFINSVGYAQVKGNANLNLKISIIDSVSNLSIDRVAIKLNGVDTYVSNTQGIVKFQNSLTPYDTLTFSCVGYLTKKLAANDPMFVSGHIYLKPANSTLAEVKIVGKQYKTISLGNNQTKYNWHRVLHPGQMLAQYIPNTQNLSGIILAINYVVNDEVLGIDKPFRVGLYTKSDGAIFPDSVLLSDTVIVYNPKKSRTIRVDLSGYKIKFPQNGVIATFEILDTLSTGENEKVWYHNRWEYKSPGIDIYINQKGYYAWDPDKNDRKDAFCMVLHTNNIFENHKLIVTGRNQFMSYLFPEVVQSSITITIGLDE